MKLGRDSQLVVLGAPGCGKTTALLRAVEKHLAAGVAPNNIAFVSFTRKAIREAVERACNKFALSIGDLPYFKTIHSLCYQQLGLGKDQVMGPSAYKEIGRALGIDFTGARDEDGSGLPVGGSLGDKLLQLYELSRVTCLTIEEAYHIYATDRSFTFHHFKQFCATVEKYRRETGLVDFTAMLEQFISIGQPVRVGVAIIDEAQDLSLLQWKVLEVAFKDTPTIYVGGDDDQRIFEWSGADAKTFLGLNGRKIILGKSFRIPAAVHKLALQIISPVSNRYVKKFVPKPEEGSVEWLSSPDQVDLSMEGSWLLLVRNVFQISELEQLVKNRGMTYVSRGGHPSVKRASTRAIVTWEKLRKGETCSGEDIRATYDYLRVGGGVKRGFKALSKIQEDQQYSIAELKKDWGLLRDDIWHEALEIIPIEERTYYLTVLRRGGVKALRDPPRVRIDTIHGVKGGEAENVMVMTDLARKTYEQYQQDQDAERRVYYVGVTRAKQNLRLVMPQTSQSFVV